MRELKMDKLKEKLKNCNDREKAYLKEKLWNLFQNYEGFWFEIDAYDFIEDSLNEFDYLEEAYKEYLEK